MTRRLGVHASPWRTSSDANPDLSSEAHAKKLTKDACGKGYRELSRLKDKVGSLPTLELRCCYSMYIHSYAITVIRRIPVVADILVPLRMTRISNDTVCTVESSRIPYKSECHRKSYASYCCEYSVHVARKVVPYHKYWTFYIRKYLLYRLVSRHLLARVNLPFLVFLAYGEPCVRVPGMLQRISTMTRDTVLRYAKTSQRSRLRRENNP